MPVNACGGIFTADDAMTCLDAGATTVQIYSALVYEGPGIVGEIASGLSERFHGRQATTAITPMPRVR